jgi:hypothetical protein
MNNEPQSDVLSCVKLNNQRLGACKDGESLEPISSGEFEQIAAANATRHKTREPCFELAERRRSPEKTWSQCGGCR